MGLFSKALGFATLGLVGDSPFEGLRSGATQAGKNAEALGYEQLADERAFGEELKGITQPGIDMGQQASQSLYDYYSGDSGAQQQFVDNAQRSPYYRGLVDEGEQSVARHASATGGIRGGNIQESLASVNQNALNTVVNQNLQGLQGISDYGLNTQNQYIGGKGGNVSNIGQTRSGIAEVGVGQAANKQQQTSGLLGLLGGLI